MASTGIASYGSTDSEMKPPLKRTMPTRFMQLFRAHLSAALNFVEPLTRKRLGKCVGVYAFYDFDGEPIYVGQTTEDFATRIGRVPKSSHYLQFRQLGSSLCVHQRGSHIAPLIGAHARESQCGRSDPMISPAVYGLLEADPHDRLLLRLAKATLPCVG